MHNLAQTLAAELAPRRIRVNSVSPGYIDTPAFRAETSHEARAVIGATLAAGRVGTAEEVAAAVAFLASDEASYVNGQDLLVEGRLRVPRSSARDAEPHGFDPDAAWQVDRRGLESVGRRRP